MSIKPVKAVPEVLTLEEAARYLRVPKATVQKYAELGNLPGRQMNKQWRFLKCALDDWLRGPERVDGKTAMLQIAGALKGDETLPQLRAAIYAARGRPEVEEEGE